MVHKARHSTTGTLIPVDGPLIRIASGKFTGPGVVSIVDPNAGYRAKCKVLAARNIVSCDTWTPSAVVNEGLWRVVWKARWFDHDGDERLPLNDLSQFRNLIKTFAQIAR